MHWDKKFQSPFKSDVYFFSTRQQTAQKWGTATPITIRDKEFGAVRVRGYGIYAGHVFDARIGMNMVGDLGRYAQFQAGTALPIAAANQRGGGAAAGIGLGAGLAMGPQLMNVMKPAAVAAAAADAKFCISCGKLMTRAAKFCPQCGGSQQ